jgi:hypothetical protein
VLLTRQDKFIGTSTVTSSESPSLNVKCGQSKIPIFRALVLCVVVIVVGPVCYVEREDASLTRNADQPKKE